MTELKSKVAVIGQGTMGAGITEVFAKAGWDVRAVDNNDASLERGRKILKTSTDKAVSRGKLSAEEQEAVLGRVAYHTNIAEAVADVDLVMEVVFENLEVKLDIFRQLDAAAPPNAILATNTSSLSVTSIATAVKDPSRVIGVHFFNPAPVQKLVELIRTVQTSDDIVDRLDSTLREIGKTPIRCTDRAGFIVNALLIPYLGSAVRLFAQGFATREELDTLMVEKAGYPMGPLTLMDMVGNDVCLAVLEKMYDETKDRLNAPTPLLTQMVTSGLLGRKSGQGFYTYGEDGKPTDAPGPVRRPRQSRGVELPDRLVGEYLNHAIRMVEVNYASMDEIDTGMALGCRMPRPFEVLAEMGPKRVLEICEGIYAETAEPGHRPARLLRQLSMADDPKAALDDLRTRTAQLHAHQRRDA